MSNGSETPQNFLGLVFLAQRLPIRDQRNHQIGHGLVNAERSIQSIGRHHHGLAISLQAGLANHQTRVGEPEAALKRECRDRDQRQVPRHTWIGRNI